ncbi:hypothetical protein MKW98_007309, partial [Papaver atlanticum]
ASTALQSWHLQQSSSDKVCSEETVINKAIYCIYSWSLIEKEFASIHSSDVLKNW